VPEQIGSRSVRYRFEFERGGEKIATGRMTAVYCRKTENGIESLEIPAEIRSKLEA
jgi:acyl-CoA thioesterase FadM